MTERANRRYHFEGAAWILRKAMRQEGIPSREIEERLARRFGPGIAQADLRQSSVEDVNEALGLSPAEAEQRKRVARASWRKVTLDDAQAARDKL